MKRFLVLFLAFSTLLGVGCSGSAGKSEGEIFQKIFTPTYSSGFEILKFDPPTGDPTEKNGMAEAENSGLPSGSSSREGDDRVESTLVTIRNPWQGASGVEQHLLILRGHDKAPEGFEGEVVHAPIRKVACLSSTHVAMFDALGESGRVVGVSGLNYIFNPSVRERAARGEVHDLGMDSNLNFELLASLKPDLVMLYGVTGENSVVTGKLRELSIPYIYIGDYVEESPLGKAEWMVLTAELCDRRAEGIERFEAVAGRYEEIRRQILESRSETEPRPLVMLNTPWRDTWFMPSSRSYMVRLIEDAGGEYIYPNDSDHSVPIDLEEAYLMATRADVWINTGSCTTLDELKAGNPKFARVKSVVEGRVWNNNRRGTPEGGSDFWESGIVRPDVILSDLHTLLYRTGDSTVFYQPLE